jgi:hypothetical protein
MGYRPGCRHLVGIFAQKFRIAPRRTVPHRQRKSRLEQILAHRLALEPLLSLFRQTDRNRLLFAHNLFTATTAKGPILAFLHCPLDFEDAAGGYLRGIGKLLTSSVSATWQRQRVLAKTRERGRSS